MMQTIWLIRHAQSESNAGLPTSDPSQIQLTAQGEAQARCLAAAFQEPPSLIVTSSYRRTQQTAQPTRERFPDVPHEQWPVEEFTYLAPATCSETTRAQRRPLIQAYWGRADPFYVDGPGAESFVQLVARIQQTLTRIKGSRDAFIVIFTHGLFIRTLLWLMLASPDAIGSDQMKQCRAFCESFAFPNTGILKMRLTGPDEFTFSTIITAHLPGELLLPG